MAKKVLRVASAISPFGLLGMAGKALLGKKKKSTPAATPTPEVPTMPLADDEAVMRARKEALLRRRGAGGRSSTILTGGDVLGGY